MEASRMENIIKSNGRGREISPEDRKIENKDSKDPERFLDRDWKEFYFVHL
jgi:hypothetical protein